MSSLKGLSAIAEMKVWLEKFDRRKAELIAQGYDPDAADEQAAAEIRKRIRLEGFKQGGHT